MSQESFDHVLHNLLPDFSIEEISGKMRERAFRICKDYLHGTWRQISSEDMIIKQISGGLSNMLYYCGLPSTANVKGNEPAEVLVRIYGRTHGEDALEQLLAESVIFTLLSERRLGPRLYGVFPGGRLEQFIKSRSLRTEELGDKKLSSVIGDKMARMHALNLPISKEPTWMWDSMNKWLKSAESFLDSDDSSNASNISTQTFNKLRSHNYRHELQYLKNLVSYIQSPVVFAHNDMQEGNVLLTSNPKKPSELVSLIDFEYACYNFRGFDLANHFCEWMYSYHNPEHPYFDVDYDNFPSEQQQLIFIRSYLAAYESACGRKNKEANVDNLNEKKNSQSHDPSNGNKNLNKDKESLDPVPGTYWTAPSHPAEEKLLKEVQVFRVASHLFWALWSIVQGQVCKISFGYYDYASVRMDHYHKDKEHLQKLKILKRESDEIV